MSDRKTRVANALNGFYRKHGNDVPKVRRKRSTSKDAVPSEYVEQLKICRVLRQLGLWYWHTPNGGARDKIEAARLRHSGVLPGVADLIVMEPVPGSSAWGVCIEVKRSKGGVVSKAQKEFLRQWAARGGLAFVARGGDPAIELITTLYVEKSYDKFRTDSEADARGGSKRGTASIKGIEQIIAVDG